MINNTGIVFPWHRRTRAAKTLYAMSHSLGLKWDFQSIHRAVNKTLDNHRYSFRLGGASFDIPVGMQRAAIRCDIGTLAGVEIVRDL